MGNYIITDEAFRLLSRYVIAKTEDGTPQQLPLAVTLDWAEEIVRRVKTYGYIATINKV